MHLPEWFSSIRHLDALVPDLNGILRGKRLPAGDIDKLTRRGLQLPGTVFTTDITGATVDLEHLGLFTGDPDHLCVPCPETLCQCPWSTDTGQVLLTMQTLDGEDLFADPRQRLKAVLDRFSECGLKPIVALELEFYLTEYVDGSPQPNLPRSPSSGEKEWGVQVYGMTELWDFGAVLDDIGRFCETQRVPATAASSEYAPGQFEINLNHTSNVLLACDHALMLKNIVRKAAARHGMCATFMAKPFEQIAGNGCHVHVSVVDDSGQNIFSDDEPTGSDQLKQAIAGLLNSMDECTAIFAPGANSYRRLVKGSFAPVQKTWDVNNRTVSVRIPASDAESRRLEHRVAGADVNPYLLCAAVLGGILHGLKTKQSLPDKVEGNAYKQVHPELPDNWLDALRLFGDSDFAVETFGSQFVEMFRQVKEHERRLFEQTVTPTEISWYLRRI